MLQSTEPPSSRLFRADELYLSHRNMTALWRRLRRRFLIRSVVFLSGGAFPMTFSMSFATILASRSSSNCISFGNAFRAASASWLAPLGSWLALGVQFLALAAISPWVTYHNHDAMVAGGFLPGRRCFDQQFRCCALILHTDRVYHSTWTKVWRLPDIVPGSADMYAPSLPHSAHLASFCTRSNGRSRPSLIAIGARAIAR